MDKATNVAEMPPEVNETVQVLIARGLVPHSLPVPLGGNETWWEYPGNRPEHASQWPMTVILIAFMIFIVVLIHGWPVL